jgi:membrane-anchored protein YejM (alkaline phosphatase superfamily)
MVIVPQLAESVLFITLDSCRYDTFVNAKAPNLKATGQLYQAMAPSYFTYASHQAMFVGFTPGIAHQLTSFLNPKYGKIFRMVGSAAFGNELSDYFLLEGKNIIDGFKRKGFLTVGTGAVGWFNPATETAQALIQDFDHFYYPGNTYSLEQQLEWIYPYLHNPQQKLFLFLNIGETHTPYYYKGANWDPNYNPCVPFGDNNDAEECRQRQLGCLEYVDSLLETLLRAFRQSTVFICGDHGDCWGEDGLWEHGFHHEKVLQVPLLFKLGAKLKVMSNK